MEGDKQPLGRAERRYLRRVFHGRVEPLLFQNQPLLTFKDASRFLEALEGEAREAAYVALRSQVEAERAPV